ncbi:LuxR C-terminal-related transcriptional regulator [Cellulomonas persica]
MLTTFHDEEYVTGALRAGADAFLLKDTEPATLVATVHRVRAGEQVLDPKVTGVVVSQWRTWAAGRSAPDPAAASGPAGAVASLTQREREVLIAVARGGSNPDVADQLRVGEATVKAHIHALLRKLDRTTRTQLVVAAYE